MSDNKLNSLGFEDDDILSSLENLKAKYSNFEEQEDKTDLSFFLQDDEADIDEPIAKDEDDIEEEVFSKETSDLKQENDIFSSSVFQEPIKEGFTFFDDDEDDNNDDFAVENTLELEEAENLEPDYNDFYDDDEDDDFADLDDEDDVFIIKKDSPSPLVSAFKDAANEPQKSKAPKQKKAKKEPGKNTRKILNIAIAIAVPIVLWIGVFVTDIVLVSNWYTPFFCTQTETYQDGSKTYVGAFYKMQFHVDENGEVGRECLPWFVDGPNDGKIK